MVDQSDEGRGYIPTRRLARRFVVLSRAPSYVSVSPMRYARPAALAHARAGGSKNDRKIGGRIKFSSGRVA
eukprot:3261174-Pyramimonas_sp.AAC.3